MKKIKNIALVAHNNMKNDLYEWVDFNKKVLINHNIISTGGTGSIIKNIINDIKILKNGSLGGEQQLGAMISNDEIDILIFFTDSLQAQSNDVDIKAMLRIAVLYNIPTACNRSTADFLISSSLFDAEYHQVLKDFSNYIKRKI